MSGLLIGAAIAALLVLLFAADWLLAGRTKKRLTAQQQSPAALSRRDAVRAGSQNNATRIDLSGPGSGSGG